MNDIEKCRALAIAMNSVRFNPKLSTIEVQSLETAYGAMIAEIEDKAEHEYKMANCT